jgi:hypothetical protein
MSNKYSEEEDSNNSNSNNFIVEEIINKSEKTEIIGYTENSSECIYKINKY